MPVVIFVFFQSSFGWFGLSGRQTPNGLHRRMGGASRQRRSRSAGRTAMQSGDDGCVARQRRRRSNFQTRRARQSTPSGKTRIDDAHSLRVPTGVGKAEIAKSEIAKSETAKSEIAKTFPDGVVFESAPFGSIETPERVYKTSGSLF
ncbi:MAG: hypothetical protein WA268_16725 [Xanthobacteraceae bacterium]